MSNEKSVAPSAPAPLILIIQLFDFFCFYDFNDLNDLDGSDYRRLSPVFNIPFFHYSFLLVTLSVKHS
jgi:hypothetical protein